MKKLGAYKVYLIFQGAASLFFSLVFTFNMVYQATVAGLNPLQLVLVGTALEASVFLGEVPTGIVADLYSRRLSIIIGVFLIGCGFLLEGSIPLFITILLAQALWGIGYTFTSGATQAWISDEIGEEAAGKAFLRGSQMGMIGGLIGLAVSMALVNVRINLPIQIGGLLFILLGFFLLATMPENGFRPTPREERSTWKDMGDTFRSGLGMIKRRPALLTILLIGLFYGLYSEAYDRLWVKRILDDFTLPALGQMDSVLWFGVIRAVGMALSLTLTEFLRRRLDTNHHQKVARTLSALTGLLILSLVVFALSGNFALAIAAVWAVGVTRSLIGPIYTAWVNQRLDSKVRATVLSMSSQVDAIGQIAGGPVLGMVGNAISVRAAITAAAAVLSPILVLFSYTIRRHQEQPLDPDLEPAK